MAKWGKGDPRWIVEERPDSKNVNNWHWTERDATTWSKTKLKELFLNISEETEAGYWKIDEVKKIDGEATINNRKGKLIFFYEWVIKLEYKGKVCDSELSHSGSIDIPNLSDENDASEVDATFKANSDSKNSEALKDIVRKSGINLIRKVCETYIKDLKSEYASGMVLPTKDGAALNGTPTIQSNTKKVQNKLKDLNVNNTKTETIKKVTKHVSVNLKEEFRTTADELYQTLTENERISAFAGSHCISNATVGGEFVIMGGNISGTYVELVKDKKIVQKWRFKDWPEGLYSLVTIDLDQTEDRTILTLNQTGVPDYDTVKTKEGWKRHFFGPIKQVFGFGAQLY